VPKEQYNFRLDERTAGLLKQLAEHMALSLTDVVTQAVRQLARRELPRPTKEKLKNPT
jgi:hypothetical protein